VSYAVDEVGGETITSLLPSSLLKMETPLVSLVVLSAPNAVNPMLTPHSDINRLCGVNVYLETSEETTEFYQWDGGTCSLTPIEQFIASTDSCWLMDTKTPHAVILKPGKHRKILTMSFKKTDFRAVATCLREAGYAIN
jgi:hypothetical protein